MHRNTYINSPGLLDATYRLIKRKNIFFAGQLTGVEGYGISLLGSCGRNKRCTDGVRMKPVIFPDNTVIGGLAAYISSSAKGTLQPMNANFGIVNHNIQKQRDKKKRNLKLQKLP